MRLLVDVNLSPALIRQLSDLFPDSRHVRSSPGRNATDEKVWHAARDEGFILLTKDEDFEPIAILHGPPLKVVWVSIGNCSTAQVVALVRANFDSINAFSENGEASFLAIG